MGDQASLNKMNQEIDKLKLKYQPIISENAGILDAHKKKHRELLARKEELAEQLTRVDKSSGTFVLHSIEKARARVAELTQLLAVKKEY